MTLDLDAIRARAEAATAGPWTVEWETDGDGEPMGEWWTYVLGVEAAGGRTVFRYDDDYGTDQNADAEFIAHARSDVPALVEEVERLRAELAACRRPEVPTDPLRRPVPVDDIG